MFDRDAWDATHARIQRDYADYLALLNEEAHRQNVCGPHCDAYALHKPGDCEACDSFPVLQAFRRDHHIAFTGEKPGDSERPCPATLLRHATTIHRWHGNRPDQRADEGSKETSDDEPKDYLHWSEW